MISLLFFFGKKGLDSAKGSGQLPHFLLEVNHSFLDR